MSTENPAELSRAALPKLEAKTSGLALTAYTPILVCVSGFPDDHQVWEKQIDYFGNKYHIITICMPDYDQPGLRASKWGYKPEEVVEMMKECLDSSLRGSQQKYDLIVHDWGSYYGHLMASPPPGEKTRVRKMVVCDVGCGIKISSIPLILLYQSVFSIIFWIGVRISPSLADKILLVFHRYLWRFVGPLNYSFSYEPKRCPKRNEDIRWFMCYPYFQLLFNHLFRGRLVRESKFLNIPTLYIYAKQKRIDLHSDAYIRCLETAKGCGVLQYDCSHWVMWEKAYQFNKDVERFLTK